MKRLVFYQDSLGQAGSERALYELVRALDPSLYSVRVLTGTHEPEQHFERLLHAGGTCVERFDPWPRVPHWMPLRFRGRWEVTARNRLGDSLRGRLGTADGLVVFLIENYRAIREWIGGVPTALFHMSHSAQYARFPFTTVLPGEATKLVLMDPSQSHDLAPTPWATVDRELLPLLLRTEEHPETYSPPAGSPLRIGYFSRLSPEKPLEPFLFALHVLRGHVDARLHVYGGGDSAAYGQMLRYLGLEQAVSFEGHRKDLSSVLADGLALGWMPSLGDFVGYASLELAAAGLPLLFWNLGGYPVQPGSVFESSRDVAGLAARTLDLCSDPGALVSRGRRLRDHVIQNHDALRQRDRLNALFARLFPD